MKKRAFYRRTADSPWMAVPVTTRGAFERFLILGVYSSIRVEEIV